MNRPDYIDDTFAAAGLPIPFLALVSREEDEDFPIHIQIPEIGWIVWSKPENN